MYNEILDDSHLYEERYYEDERRAYEAMKEFRSYPEEVQEFIVFNEWYATKDLPF